jgi:signal peptide peptidase SppA
MRTSQHLPFLMHEVFDRPHLVSTPLANMIVAVLAGKLDIRALRDEFNFELDARGMQDLAEMGRLEARQRRAHEDSQHTGVARGEDTPYEATESGIAILPVQGVLKRTWGVGPMSGATGYDGLWTQLLHAVDNPKIKAIWMNHNSGGGTVDGLFDLADAIYANSARFGGKPIWAMAADVSLSASYALAAAADKVFVPQLGQIGSIGAVIIHAEMSKALEEEGITVTIFRSKEGKMRGNSLEALDEATATKFQAMVDEVDEVFVDRVALYRGLKKKAVHETNADVYSGRQALTTGLVSEILSEPEAWMKLERKIARN